MKEYKVGERFYHDGVLLEVVRDKLSSSHTCKEIGCYFAGNCNFIDCGKNHYEQVNQSCNCANYKPKRTETRVKQPEALIKVLLDGGWKPVVDAEGIYFKKPNDVGFPYGMWQSCGKKPSDAYIWHESWLEEVEV